MAFNYSPKIVTDGLVLYYDTANTKSYDRSENLALNSEALNLWSNNGGAISITPNVEIAPNGTLTADTLAQTAATGASRWISSINNRTYTAGVTYTLSIWLKKVSGTDGQPSIRLWVNGGMETSIGTITNEWVRYSATFTPSSTISVNTFSGLNTSWGTNGQANNFVFAAWGFQIERGSSATTYIPTTSTPKLTGTTWIDLSRSGVNGTLVNGPTFDFSNGGNIVCDGVDDYILQTSPTLTTFSFEILYSPLTFDTNSSTNRYNYIIGSFGSNMFMRYNTNSSGNNILLANHGGSDINIGGLGHQVNNIYNVTVTFDDSTKQTNVYFNGVLRTTATYNATLRYQGSRQLGATFNSRFYSYKVYNRILSATEVLQNYNATKTRFGL